MTIASATNKSGPYNGNGVTVAFSGTFKISDQDHVQVILADADGVETVQTITTEYTVSGVGGSGFTVTMLVAPPSGSTVTLIRDVPFTQELDLQNQGAYYAESVEEAFDLAAARDQQLQEQVSRSVKIPASADVAELDTLIANIVLLGDSADDLAALAAISADVETLAAITAAISTVAGISTAVTTVAGISVAVQAVAAVEAELLDVHGALAAIIAAPGYASSASASAVSAAASAAAAATFDPANYIPISGTQAFGRSLLTAADAAAAQALIGAGGMSTAERRNALLRLATIAKLSAGYQRDINAFAAGFKGASDAADGVYSAGSSAYTRDSSAGCVKPTFATTRITGATPTAPLGGTAANINDNNTGTSISPAPGNLSAVSAIGSRAVAVLDLGSVQTVTKIEAVGYSYSGGSTSSGGAFYYSTDGSSWTKLGGDLSITGSAATYDATGSVSARYVCLSLVQTNYGANTVTLQDFNAYRDAANDSTVQFLQQTVDSTGYLFAVADVHPVEAMTIGTSYIMEVYTGGGWQALTMVNAGIGETGRTIVGGYKGGMSAGTTVDVRIRTVGKDHRTYRFGYDARNAA